MGLTEAYRQVLAEYVMESDSAKFYSVLLNTLHHYVRISTVFNTISYPDCVSLYAALFVPHMYIQSMTAEQKLNILTMVIGNTIREFANDILKEHLGGIIDDHQDPINIELLQDSVLKILIKQRDISYDRFIESQKPNKKPNKKPTRTKEAIPQKSLVKLTDIFKKSINRRTLLEKKNATLISKNKQLVKQFDELKKMFLAQIAAQREQTAIIKELEQQLKNQKKPSIETMNLDTSYPDTQLGGDLGGGDLEGGDSADGDEDMFSFGVRYVDED
jgi:hypothetical protein